MAKMTPEQLAARLKKLSGNMVEVIQSEMEQIALMAETKAKENCSPDTTPYYRPIFDTGLLRSEIYHKVETHGAIHGSVSAFIVSPTEYAIPIHEGRSGMVARPYILDAINELRPDILSRLTGVLSAEVNNA